MQFQLSKKRLIITHLLLLFLVTSSSSCISIVGLTDGYKSLTKEQKEKVIEYKTLSTQDRKPFLPTGRLYAISAEDLVNDVVGNSKCKYQLVYEFNPHCNGEACIPIGLFVDICKRKDIEPIVVARYYSRNLFDRLSDSYTIFVMSREKYSSKYVPRYAVQYVLDLTNGAINYDKDEDEYYNMFLYKDGVFVKGIEGSKYLEAIENL